MGGLCFSAAPATRSRSDQAPARFNYCAVDVACNQQVTAQALQFSHAVKRSCGVQVVCATSALAPPRTLTALLAKLELESSLMAWLQDPAVAVSGNAAACGLAPASPLIAHVLVAFDDAMPAQLAGLLTSSAAKAKNASLALLDGLFVGARLRVCVVSAPPRTLKHMCVDTGLMGLAFPDFIACGLQLCQTYILLQQNAVVPFGAETEDVHVREDGSLAFDGFANSVRFKAGAQDLLIPVHVGRYVQALRSKYLAPELHNSAGIGASAGTGAGVPIAQQLCFEFGLLLGSLCSGGHILDAYPRKYTSNGTVSYDVTTASVLGHADIGGGLLQAGYTRAALKIVLSLTCSEPRERLSLQGAFEQLLDIALAINVPLTPVVFDGPMVRVPELSATPIAPALPSAPSEHSLAMHLHTPAVLFGPGVMSAAGQARRASTEAAFDSASGPGFTPVRPYFAPVSHRTYLPAASAAGTGPSAPPQHPGDRSAVASAPRDLVHTRNISTSAAVSAAVWSGLVYLSCRGEQCVVVSALATGAYVGAIAHGWCADVGVLCAAPALTETHVPASPSACRLLVSDSHRQCLVELHVDGTSCTMGRALPWSALSALSDAHSSSPITALSCSQRKLVCAQGSRIRVVDALSLAPVLSFACAPAPGAVSAHESVCTGVAVDPTRKVVYVSDASHSRVCVYSLEGVFKTALTCGGVLVRPTSIALPPTASPRASQLAVLDGLRVVVLDTWSDVLVQLLDVAEGFPVCTPSCVAVTAAAAAASGSGGVGAGSDELIVTYADVAACRVFS